MAESLSAASEVTSPFDEPASDNRLAHVARALEANCFATQIVDTGATMPYAR
jgi:hypothetical protein